MVSVLRNYCGLIFGLALISSGALSLIAVASLPLNHVAGESPLVCSKSVLDVGPTKQGAVHEVQFELHNRSRYQILLGMPKTACSCTVADLSTSVMPPGDSTKLIAKWETLDSVGPSSVGLVVPYEIIVNGKPLAREPLILRISGTVKPTFTLLPGELVFTRSKSSEAAIELVSETAESGIASASPIHRGLLARVEQIGLTCKVTVLFDSEEWERTRGGARSEVLLQTTVAHPSTLSIPVFVNCNPLRSEKPE